MHPQKLVVLVSATFLQKAERAEGIKLGLGSGVEAGSWGIIIKPWLIIVQSNRGSRGKDRYEWRGVCLCAARGVALLWTDRRGLTHQKSWLIGSRLLT